MPDATGKFKGISVPSIPWSEKGHGMTPSRKSNTEINAGAIDDMGPIGKVPKLVGICTEHGFWFEARSQQESCPESYCLAPVHFYAWRNEYAPDDPKSDDE